MKIGQLEIDLLANVARLQADMAEVKRSVGGSMAYVQQAADMAKTAMIGLVGIGGVAAFAGMVRSSIEGAAALNDLAIQSGMSVESLSALASVGKTTSTSAETISNASNKLAKTLAGATEESKGAGTALRAMGISFDEFVQLSPDQQMVQLAKSMEGFADGSGKSAAAQALLGKEGAKLLPFLKDLALTGELHAKVTAEQAAQADQFSDNLTMLQASGEGWKKELSMGMLPALSTASQAVLDVMNGTGGLRDEIKRLSADGTLKSWTYSTIEGFTYLLDAASFLKRVFVSIGETIAAGAAQAVQFFGGLGDAIVKVMKGDFNGAVESVKAGYAGMTAVGQEWAAEQEKAWGAQTLGSKIRDRMADLKAMGSTAEAAKPQIDLRQPLDGNAASAKKAADEYGKLIDKINGQLAAGQLQLTQGDKLTAAQKEALDLMVRLRDGTLRLTDAQKVELTSKLELLRANERHIDTMGEEAKLQADMAKDRDAIIDAVGKQTQAYQEQLDKEAEELLQLQLGSSAYQQLTIARMYDLAAQKEAIAATSDQSEQFLRQAELLRQRAALMQEGIVVKEAQAAAAEWKKTTDQIENGLTDSLMRAFESGKGFMSAFRDTLINAFKTLILKPIIQPIVSAAGSIIGAIGQGLFGTAAATAAGSATAGSGMGTGVGVGVGLAGMAGAFGTGLTGGILGTLGGSASFGGLMSAAGSLVGTGSGAGVAAGIGMGIGAVAPYLLGAYALYKTLGSGGTPHVGAMMSVDQYGNTVAAAGQEKYTKAETWNAISAIGASSLNALNTLSKSFGGTGGYTGRFGFKADGEDASYAYLTLMKAGQAVGGWSGAGSDWSKHMRDYQVDAKASLESYQRDVASAVRSTLYGMDLPAWAKSTLDALGDTATVDQLSAAAQQIAQVNLQLQGMSSSFSPLGGIFSRIAAQSSDAQYQLAQFSGGIDQLISNAQTFASKYYGTDEQHGIQAASLLAQFKALGLDSVPTTLTEFRKLVEGQNLQTEDGRLRVAALLEMSGQFASVQEYLTQQGTTMQQLAALAPQGAVFDELTNAQKRQADAAAAQADLAARQAAAAESTAASIVSLGELLGGKLDGIQTAINDGLRGLRNDMAEVYGA